MRGLLKFCTIILFLNLLSIILLYIYTLYNLKNNKDDYTTEFIHGNTDTSIYDTETTEQYLYTFMPGIESNDIINLIIDYKKYKNISEYGDMLLEFDYDTSVKDISLKLDSKYIDNINQSRIISLSFISYPIKNITFLNDFTELKYLILSYNHNIENLSQLNIPSLISLKIADTNVIDLSFLNNFKNLTELDLSYNTNMKNIEYLDLKHLDTLVLSCSNITYLLFLNNFKKLTYLDLSHNHYLNLYELNRLNMSLDTLLLVNCSITHISLNNLKQLSVLYLTNNKITDLNELKIKSDLRYLYIAENDIKNITYINKFNNLTYLDLNSNVNIVNLHKLNISSLQELCVYNCNIFNTSFVKNLSKLRRIDIDTEIISIDELKNMNLTHMYCT
jgi:internalin A